MVSSELPYKLSSAFGTRSVGISNVNRFSGFFVFSGTLAIKLSLGNLKTPKAMYFVFETGSFSCGHHATQ